MRVEDFTQSLGVSRDVKYDVETETVIAMLKHVDPTCSLCYDWLARQNELAVDKALDVVKRIATGVAAHAQSAFAEIPGLANIVLEANRLLLEDLRCAYSVNHGEQ